MLNTWSKAMKKDDPDSFEFISWILESDHRIANIIAEMAGTDSDDVEKETIKAFRENMSQQLEFRKKRQLASQMDAYLRPVRSAMLDSEYPTRKTSGRVPTLLSIAKDRLKEVPIITYGQPTTRPLNYDILFPEKKA